MTAADIDTLARELGIDAAAVVERQAFLDFTDRDAALLVELHDLIERASGLSPSFATAARRASTG